MHACFPLFRMTSASCDAPAVQHEDGDQNQVYYSARSIAHFCAMYRAHQATAIERHPTLQACRELAEQDCALAMHDVTQLLANTAHTLAQLSCPSASAATCSKSSGAADTLPASPAATTPSSAAETLPASRVVAATTSSSAAEALPASQVEVAMRTVRQYEEALCAQYAPGLAAFLGRKNFQKRERKSLHNTTNTRA